MKSDLDERAFKRVLKEALSETLQEQRQLLRDVFANALEDFALAEAIREGQQSPRVSRDDVMRQLRPRR
jgi:hypothetical protein